MMVMSEPSISIWIRVYLGPVYLIASAILNTVVYHRVF